MAGLTRGVIAKRTSIVVGATSTTGSAAHNSIREVLLEMSRLVDGPIRAEVVTTDPEAMVKEGRELTKVHQKIVVKVPLIPDGLRATRKLTAEGI
jgi:transaldolase